MNNVLVTGGAGFIGSNLVKKLLVDDEHSKIYVVDNFTTGKVEIKNKRVKYFNKNVNDIFKIRGLHQIKFSVIFHLAAKPRIQPSFKDPVGTMEANFNGTQAALEFARYNKCKLIYAGSSSAAGDPNVNPYTASKYYGEQLLELYSKSFGVETISTRFYNVYGPGNLQDEETGNLIGILQKQYMNNTPFTIIEDCKEKRRDFTHVYDICDGLIEVYKNKNIPSNSILNLGRGVNHSIYDIVQYFQQASKREIVIETIPKRSGEMTTTLRAFTQTDMIMNFDPTLNVDEWIKEWVENYDAR